MSEVPIPRDLVVLLVDVELVTLTTTIIALLSMFVSIECHL